jgi:hypothetical protein
MASTEATISCAKQYALKPAVIGVVLLHDTGYRLSVPSPSKHLKYPMI